MDYDRLREMLRGTKPSDLVAAILEVWDQQKIDYLMEELELELSDDETEANGEDK